MLLLVLGSFAAQGQVVGFRSTAFAFKEGYKNWSSWEKSNLKIVIDFNNDVVTINSERYQRYQITQYVKRYYDNNGGETIEFRFIDQDYDRGTMRLRVDPYGTSQIYIDFSNVSWVYNIVPL